LKIKSDDLERFFPNVMAELKRRGIDEYIINKFSANSSVSANGSSVGDAGLFIDISNASPDGLKVPPSRIDLLWLNYSAVYHRRFE
jgi:hypothetical protein